MVLNRQGKELTVKEYQVVVKSLDEIPQKEEIAEVFFC